MNTLDAIKIGGKKVVGYVDWEHKRYVTRRNHAQHYFRLHQGYGISEEILYYLNRVGVKKVRMIEKKGEEERVLDATVKDFMEKGLRWADKTHTSKTEYQRMLPTSDMKVHECTRKQGMKE